MSVDHYENFPVATRLVPARVRPAVIALYRFARSADDIADEGNDPPAERLAALDAYEEALRDIANGHVPSAAPLRDLALAIARHSLPLAPLHDLLSAFRQDVTTGRYAQFTDLLDYCRRSANPVGRLVLCLYRTTAPDAVAASDAVCTGLQLANFCQDVALDWRKNRLYLPQEDLARFRVSEAHIAQGECGAPWRSLMAFETARARGLLASGRPLVRALPWRAGLELSAVIAGGMRILDRIDRVGGDVFTQRPVMRASDWLVVAGRALLPVPRGPVPQP